MMMKMWSIYKYEKMLKEAMLNSTIKHSSILLKSDHVSNDKDAEWKNIRIIEYALGSKIRDTLCFLKIQRSW